MNYKPFEWILSNDINIARRQHHNVQREMIVALTPIFNSVRNLRQPNERIEKYENMCKLMEAANSIVFVSEPTLEDIHAANVILNELKNEIILFKLEI